MEYCSCDVTAVITNEVEDKFSSARRVSKPRTLSVICHAQVPDMYSIVALRVTAQ